MQFEFDPNDHRCRYLRINGARCRQPALDGQDLCFEHKLRKLRTKPGRRPVALPSSTFNEVPLVSFCYIEDHASILSNLNHVIEAFAHGAIDHRQAVAYGCLLRTGLKTLRQMHDLEDLAVKEKEKPAQRFELDECELPLAIDEPAPVQQPSEAVPPVAVEQTLNPDAPASPLSAVRSPLPPERRHPSPFVEIDSEKFPMRAAKRSKEIWEENVRDYYHNDPTLLATLNVHPRPEAEAANSEPAPEPQAAPCTPHPEPCTLSALTAAADPAPCPLYAIRCPLPTLSPIPHPLSPAVPHTYTTSQYFSEQPQPVRSTIEDRERSERASHISLFWKGPSELSSPSFQGPHRCAGRGR